MSVEQEVVKAMLHYETESVKVIPPELIHAYHLACVRFINYIPTIRTHLYLPSSSFAKVITATRVLVFVIVPAQFTNHVVHMLSRGRWIQELLSPDMDLVRFKVDVTS